MEQSINAVRREIDGVVSPSRAGCSRRSFSFARLRLLMIMLAIRCTAALAAMVQGLIKAVLIVVIRAKYRVKVMAEVGTCLNVHRAQEFLLAEPELKMTRVGSLRTRQAQRRMQ
jgi:hypothetical protein